MDERSYEIKLTVFNASAMDEITINRSRIIEAGTEKTLTWKPLKVVEVTVNDELVGIYLPKHYNKKLTITHRITVDPCDKSEHPSGKKILLDHSWNRVFQNVADIPEEPSSEREPREWKVVLISGKEDKCIEALAQFTDDRSSKTVSKLEQYDEQCRSIYKFMSSKRRSNIEEQLRNIDGYKFELINKYKQLINPKVDRIFQCEADCACNSNCTNRFTKVRNPNDINEKFQNDKIKIYQRDNVTKQVSQRKQRLGGSSNEGYSSRLIIGEYDR
eukprot:UN24302